MASTWAKSTIALVFQNLRLYRSALSSCHHLTVRVRRWGDTRHGGRQQCHSTLLQPRPRQDRGPRLNRFTAEPAPAPGGPFPTSPRPKPPAGRGPCPPPVTAPPPGSFARP